MKLRTTVTAACFVSALFFALACGNQNGSKPAADQTAAAANPQDNTNNQPEVHGAQIKEGDIQLTNPLDQKLVAEGKATYELKCQSCHKTTGEKLVGPGWKDVTIRRTPVWIMNMITNVDMMLESDPEAQKLLEQCLVRMPNQNISKDEARSVLEFMRKNDGGK